eukprot:11366829-Heterocapsa_arctica.AAC.1
MLVREGCDGQAVKRLVLLSGSSQPPNHDVIIIRRGERCCKVAAIVERLRQSQRGQRQEGALALW